MSFREKFIRFMYGRYGMDQLTKFIMWFTFALCILSVFIRGRAGSIISLLIFAGIVLSYFRMFSKNIYKRSYENDKYLKLTANVRNRFFSEKKIFSQRRYYHFYRCPSCRQRIRIPRGKGRIEIRCPKCNTKFIKNS